MAGVNRYLEQQSSTFPPSLKIQKLREFTKITENRLNILRNNALLGLVLVMAVLIMFLNLRIALWTSLGIPIALGIGIIAHGLTGGTVDSIAITTFILVLGMLVDDAIVIAENIYRHRQNGMAWYQAAIKALGEVAAPVTASVATTILAFSPMLALGGTLGPFVKMIPIIVAGTLLGSLIESFFILPSHLAGHQDRTKSKNKPALIDPVFKPLKKMYKNLIAVMLKRRYLSLLLGVTVMVGLGALAIVNVKFVLFPQEGAERFFIHAEAKHGTSFAATKQIITKVEHLLANLPAHEIENFETNLGIDSTQDAQDVIGEHLAFLRVKLSPYGERHRTALEIMEDIRQQAKSIKGLTALTFELDSGGPPVGRPVELNLIGNTIYQQPEVAHQLLAYLKSIPGVMDPTSNLKYTRDEQVIMLNHLRLAKRGLTVNDVANTVRLAFEGLEVSTMRINQEDVGIRVHYNLKSRQNAAILDDIEIINPYGKLIPLKELMNVRQQTTIERINHFQGQQAITLSADVDTTIITSNEVLVKLKQKFQTIRSSYPNVRLEVTGEGKESANTVGNMMRATILAILAVYFVLVLLLNSLIQPLIVLVAVPFGVVGVLLAFWMQNMTLGFLALIGITGMSGVVVNASLIILSFIRQLAKSRQENTLISLTTILDAVEIRFRPVLLTTLTTTAGLLPTAYGLGGTDPFVVPMVMAMLWGLVFATTMTLIWVPVMVAIGQDLKQRIWLRKPINIPNTDKHEINKNVISKASALSKEHASQN